jgi:hypothetical protein
MMYMFWRTTWLWIREKKCRFANTALDSPIFTLIHMHFTFIFILFSFTLQLLSIYPIIFSLSSFFLFLFSLSIFFPYSPPPKKNRRYYPRALLCVCTLLRFREVKWKHDTSLSEDASSYGNWWKVPGCFSLLNKHMLTQLQLWAMTSSVSSCKEYGRVLIVEINVVPVFIHDTLIIT